MRSDYDALLSQRCGIAMPKLSRRDFARVTGLTAGAVALGATVWPTMADAAPAFPVPNATSVVYVPHQDDDVLSFGLYIVSQTRAGNDVHVVLYTDGSGTGVCGPDPSYSVCQADDEYGGGTVDDFVTARDAEFVASATALGVKPENIHIGTPGMTRARDGKSTLGYAEDVIRYWINRYPRATHVAYSWIDTHADHSNGGRSLRSLVAAGVLPAGQALFALARWYWQYDYPDLNPVLVTRRNELRATGGYPLAVHMFKTGNASINASYQDAIDAYRSPTNIGNRSVPLYLSVAETDPSSLLHGYASERYSTRLALLATRTGASVRIGGGVRFAGFPGFGDLGNPLALAQALDPAKIANPLLNAKIDIQLLDRTGRVVLTTSTKVKAGGRFDAIVQIPNAAVTSVKIAFAGSQGAGPVSAVKALTAAPTPKRVKAKSKTSAKSAKTTAKKAKAPTTKVTTPAKKVAAPAKRAAPTIR